MPVVTPARDDLPEFAPQRRAAWREWLRQNHASSEGVWLVYAKKSSGRASLSYDEAVEEALCFGWIDSVPRKRDEDSYAQLFSPRKAQSGWSRVNKERIERLREQGLLEEAGIAKIEAAQADGSWSKLDEVEEGVVPDDLRLALQSEPEAESNFEAFARSSRRGILEWIASAKKPEKRQARVEKTARMAGQNKRAQFDRE